MINAVLDRNSPVTGESLVIANDLTQKKLFGIRQGVEFYCLQDDNTKSRNQFLAKLIKENKIELWLDRLWDLLLCKGEVLFYLRPTGTTYRITWYDKDQFRAYYDGDGNLIKVTVIYSYKVERPTENYGTNERWIQLDIKANTIDQTDSEIKPEFDWTMQTNQMGLNSEKKTSINSLGFIPCVVAQNYCVSPGAQAANEYNWLSNQIETHDRMLRGIRENIQFFGNPTLIATRPRSELIESGIINESTTVSSNRSPYANQSATSNGWRGSNGNGLSRHDPLDRFGGGGEDYRVKKVIGNVQPNEQFGYVSPDPVSGDHNLYAREYRENLHTALGGVDPLGVNAGATAFEIKSLFGRTAATALKKANHLYTYGLCQILEMALVLEEKVFIGSFANAMKLPIEQVNESMVQAAMAEGKLPKGFNPIGLPPLGDRTVSWRWLGPVFEDSPIDLQQKSIVVRNLEEIGVETIYALKFLFTDKTEKEISQMLTGYPFREMNQTHNALGQAVSIYQQLLSVPDPANPNQPLAATLNNLPVIAQTISHLQKRLEYANQFYPASDSGQQPSTAAPVNTPTNNGATYTDPRMGSTGSSSSDAIPPTGLQSLSDPRFSGNGAPGATPTTGTGGTVPYDLPATSPAAAAGVSPAAILQSLLQSATATGLPTGAVGSSVIGGQNNQYPEYSSPIPVPGSTVTRATTTGYLPNQQPTIPGTPNSGIPAGYSTPAMGTTPGIPADLASNNVLQQLFPTISAIARSLGSNGGQQSRSNGKSKRNRK